VEAWNGGRRGGAREGKAAGGGVRRKRRRGGGVEFFGGIFPSRPPAAGGWLGFRAREPTGPGEREAGRTGSVKAEAVSGSRWTLGRRRLQRHQRSLSLLSSSGHFFFSAPESMAFPA
jgi:hypothetical protein